MSDILPDTEMLRLGWQCKCPQCKTGDIYKSRFSMDLNDTCPSCGLDLKKNDSGDGPAVFLIFILGALLVPIALFVDAALHWPLWLHACVWGVLALTMTVGSLRPIKAYILLELYFRIL